MIYMIIKIQFVYKKILLLIRRTLDFDDTACTVNNSIFIRYRNIYIYYIQLSSVQNHLSLIRGIRIICLTKCVSTQELTRWLYNNLGH